MHYFEYIVAVLQDFVKIGGLPVYASIFAAAFLECIPVAGIIVPGALILIVAGFFARLESVHFLAVFGVAALGAIIGDIGAYYLGKRYGAQWMEKHQRFTKMIYFDKGQQYFAAHGDKSVLIARFVGPIRPIIPFVSGVFQMRTSSFLFFNIVGGLLWALVFLTFGYFFGASWEIAERWASAFGFVTVVAILAVVMVYFIWRSIAQQRQAFLRLVREVTRSALETVKTNQDVQRLFTAHPRLVRWIIHRFSTKSASGLTVTIGLAVALYCLWYVIVIPFDVVARGPLFQTDIHVARLMSQLSDPVLNMIMGWVTELGSVEVVMIVATTALTVLFLLRRRLLASVWFLTLASTTMLVYLGKLLIQRPRPDIAPVINEQYFALPSGHAAHAVVLYGWLAYLVFIFVRPRRIRLALVAFLITLTLLIGASRIYLGVHWVSDVAMGYALGGLLLTGAITAAEIHRRFMAKTHHTEFFKLTLQVRCAVLLILALSLTGLTVAFVQRPIIVAQQLPVLPPQTISAQELHNYISGTMPKLTETLSGRPQEPISFILVGTAAQIEETFAKADWSIADPLTLASLRHVALASIQNDSYPTAPITPVFYNGHPHDLGVQKETDRESVRQRHHARFWKTNLRLPDGREIWVGTASYDVGIKRLVTHSINPAIDIERDYLHQEILNNNAEVSSEKIQITQSTWGRNFTGDLFFTDGSAYLLMWP